MPLNADQERRVARITVQHGPEAGADLRSRYEAAPTPPVVQGAATPRIHSIRPVARQNPDGSASTVLMTSIDNMAVPTLFPKDPDNVTPNPLDWIELPAEAALAEARKRGEVFTFDTSGEADSFALGSWKEPPVTDAFPTIVEDPVIPTRITTSGDVLDALGGVERTLAERYLGLPRLEALATTGNEAEAIRIAEEMAKKAIRTRVYSPRTREGFRATGVSTRDIRELEGFDALGESLKRQVVIPSAEEEKQLAERIMISDSERRQMMSEATAQVSVLNANPNRSVAVRNAYQDIVRANRPRFIAMARADFHDLVGREPGTTFGRMGVTTPTDPTPRQVQAGVTSPVTAEQEITDLGNSMYRQWLYGVAPELIEEIEEVKSPGIRNLFEKRDPDTDIVFESEFRRSLRLVVGGIRLLTEGWAQATTYEVDEEGNVKDPTDLNFRLKQMLPKSLADQTFANTPGGVGGSGIMMLPWQAATRTSDEMGNPAIETGDYLRDTAWSIAKMRTLGDDIQAIPVITEAVGENVAYYAGIAMELPLNLTPVGYVTGAGRAVLDSASAAFKAANWSKAARAVDAVGHPINSMRRARAYREAERAVEGLPPIRNADEALDYQTVIDDTANHIANEVVLPRKILDSFDDIPPLFIPKSHLAPYMRSAAIRQAVAETADEAGSVLTTEFLERVGQYVQGMREAKAAGRLSPEVEAAFDVADYALEGVGRGDGASAMLAGGRPTGISVLSRELHKGAEQVRRAMPESAGHEAATQAYHMVAKGVVKERLIEFVPENLHYLTPFMIISGRAKSEIASDLAKMQDDILKRTIITDGETTGILYANGDRVADELVDALGTHKINASKEWTAVVTDLRAGKAIPEHTQIIVASTITARHAEKLVEASPVLKSTDIHAPEFTGVSTRRAAVPEARRVPLVTEAVEVGATVVKALEDVVPPGFAAKVSRAVPRVMRKMLKDYAPTVFRPSGGRTQVGVNQWLKEADGLIQNNIVGLQDEIAALQKTHGDDALQILMDRTVDATRTAGVRGAALPVKTFSSWRSILSHFFGPHHALDDAALKPILGDVGTGRITAVPPITAENVAAVIARIREEIPELVDWGLSTPVAFTKTDHVAGAIMAWIAESRAIRLLEDSLDDMLAKNPEMAFSLANVVSKSPRITLGALEDTLEMAGVAKADIKAASSTANDLMRNVARTMSDEDRFNILGLAMSYKVASGDLYKELDSLAALPRAVGRLLDRKFLSEELIGRGVGSGVADETADAIIRVVTDITLAPSQEAMRGLLTATGATSKSINGMVQRILTTPSREKLTTMYGSDMAETIFMLKSAAKEGTLQRNLENLRIKDEEGFRFVMRSLGAVLEMKRRISITGLLGGTILPITRFLGLNALTAALIATTTLGVKGGVASLGFTKSNRLLNWFAVKQGKGSTVVFEANGVSWTRKMLEDAIARNNVRYSQVTYEFSDVVINTLMRQLRINPNMSKAGNVKTALRWIDPSNKNLWNRVAEMSDNYFRQNVFITALKEGKTEAEAAWLAIKALLDYGAILPEERALTSIWFLFYAFMRQMATETVIALVRNPKAIRHMMVVQASQHKQAGTWLVEPDYASQRLWASMEETFDDHYGTGVYGPDNPMLASFNDVTTAMSYLATGDVRIEDVISGVAERTFTPELELLADLQRWGPDTRSAGSVPPHHVLAMQQMGMFDAFRDNFNVVPVLAKDLRPGEPTLNGYQYEFVADENDKVHYNRYLYWNYLLTIGGVQRMLDDYAKVAIAGGLYPEGSKPKRLATGNWVMVAGSVQTPMKLPDAVALRMKQMERVARDIKALAQ